MLKYGGQHHKGIAVSAVQQQLGTCHPVLRPAAEHFLPGKFSLPALDNRHVQAGLPVIPLVKGGIISGKLELVFPGQLQNCFFRGLRWSDLCKNDRSR